MPAGNEIMIDLSSWNKNDRLHLRINEIKKAIRMKNIINFTYYTNGKLTKREVEPCVIVFKESNWYLYGYCLLRNDSDCLS
jgi:predicted DNA-binding transcriptional regulator YafY